MITNICPQCEAEMKLIPAGNAKASGKPYNAFWACDARNGGCGHKMTATDGTSSPSPKAPSPDALKEIYARLEALEIICGLKTADQPF